MAREKNINTAVILAAGRGSRMRKGGEGRKSFSSATQNLVEKGLKGLIPVAGRPFLDYTVERLVAVGIDNLCMVVSPDALEMREYGRSVSAGYNIRVSYGVQHQPRGTADAVLACEKIIGQTDFLLCNSDNLYPQDTIRELAGLPAGACAVAGFDRDVLLEKGNFSSERIKSFAALRINDTSDLAGIIEKPESTGEYICNGRLWVNMNLFRFTPEIFDSCRSINLHPERGELELPEAVSHMIEKTGKRFRIVFSEGPVLDMTGRDDIISIRKSLKEQSL